MEYPICKLCNSNFATQKNSHILPRFLKKEYLKTNKKFFIIDILSIKSKPEQDLPKEDYIFCPNCESRFNPIETIISRHLRNSYNIFKKKSYPIINLLDYKYQLFPKCDPKIFTLFVYSIIWRLHISNHLVFKDYIIPDFCVEDLQNSLNNFLSNKTSELLLKLKSFNNQRWNFIFIKPENRSKVYSNINYNESIDKLKVSFIFIFEYIILFFIENDSIPKFLENYVNQKFSNLKFMIINNKSWNETAVNLAKSLS